MRRLLFSIAVLLGLSAASASAQWILVEPGQVVAGKTLLAASQPHLEDEDRDTNLIFVGEFDEAPEDDIVDLRQGVFTLNVYTNAARLLAWTGETTLGGVPITEISSPKIAGSGQILYRVATPDVSAIMNEVGSVVAQQGESIAPGVALGDIEGVALGLGEKWVIDNTGVFDLARHDTLATFPLKVRNGQQVNDANYFDIANSDGGSFGYGGSVYAFDSSASAKHTGYRVEKGISMSMAYLARATIAESADGNNGLYLDSFWPVDYHGLVLQEGDRINNKTVTQIYPEIELTNNGRLVFSASLDGRQSILMVPEPSTMALALGASVLIVMPMLRRSLL